MKQARALRFPARLATTTALVLAIGMHSGAALAQSSAESRLSKIEAEVRALQRKVFPGADGKFFTPEITPGSTGSTPSLPPSTTAVTDLLTRMDALEAQMARLTAQIEQNGNRISLLEQRVGMDTAASAAAPASTTVSTATPASVAAAPPAASAASATPAPAPASAAAPAASQSNLNAMTGGASAAKPAAPPPSARVQAVSAIVKPQTDDAGDDEYSYGFRLWDAKFYPEAQQQLKMFLEKYPNHWRASWGRNLIGRAYLDDSNPREAAKWFLQNYQADKRSDRAPDSLLYLAKSMKQLNDTKRACIALAEFSQTYAAEAAGRLKSDYDSARNGLDCSG